MADIDTVTHDYVRTQRGDFSIDPDDADRQEMYLRLATERGSLLSAPSFGSRFHELPRRNMGPGIEQLAEDMARDALQPMFDNDRLADLEVKARAVSRSRLQVAIRARSTGGRPILFTHFVAL